MTEKSVEIQLLAQDKASATIERVRKVTQDAGQTMERTAQHSSKLERQWRDLTSAADWAAGGVKKLKNILEGILWGSIIGAASVLVSKLIEYVVKAREAEENTRKLTDTVRAQAAEWKLLPDKIHSVTQATIDLYNAQLLQSQFLQKDQGKAIEKQIKDLESWIALQREVVRKSQNFPWPLDKSVVEGIAKSETALAELRKQYEDWQNLMKMQPATLSKVKENITPVGEAAKKAASDIVRSHEALLKQASDLELQIIKLRDGEEAYIEKIRERMLVQTDDLELVSRIIVMMQVLNELQRQQQLSKLMATPPKPPKFEPMLDMPQRNDVYAQGHLIAEAEIASLKRRNKLMEEYFQLSEQATSSIYDRIIASAALGDITKTEMEQMILHIQGQRIHNALYQAGTQAVEQAILGQMQLGKALKAALAQTMAQVAAESAIRALFETAYGFASLWVNPAAAAAHFKAAGLFAAVGVAAGVTARGFVGSGGEGRQRTVSNESASITNVVATPQKNQSVQITIYGNIVDHAAFIRELQPYFKEIQVDRV